MTDIVGITFGAFDLLHPGHLTLIRTAQQKCDRLIVGLHVDPSIERPDKNRPVESVFERWVRLDAVLTINDLIIPYETERDVQNMLSTMEIHKRFLGSEYAVNNAMITGEDVCKKRGIEIIFVERFHNWSSSQLRRTVQYADDVPFASDRKK